MSEPKKSIMDSRKRLNKAFIDAFIAVSKDGGESALEQCRIRSPDQYRRLVASVFPNDENPFNRSTAEVSEKMYQGLLERRRQLQLD